MPYLNSIRILIIIIKNKYQSGDCDFWESEGGIFL
jgi:hypothetical protein